MTITGAGAGLLLYALCPQCADKMPELWKMTNVSRPAPDRAQTPSPGKNALEMEKAASPGLST